MLLAPAVFTNLRIGQGYLIVFALFAATACCCCKGAIVPRVCLGGLLALKTSGRRDCLAADREGSDGPRLPRRPSRALVVAIAITPFIDPRMWLVYPSQVRAYVERPSGSSRRIKRRSACSALVHRRSAMESRAAAELRGRSPSCCRRSSSARRRIVTIVLAAGRTRSSRGSRPARTLTVLSLPARAEPHFVLMAIPLALLPLTRGTGPESPSC
jgi:hypothetical protein